MGAFAASVTVLFLQFLSSIDCGVRNRTELELLELENRNLVDTAKAVGNGLAAALATALDASVLQVVNVRHPWATARLDPNDCQTYTVTIRYRCKNVGFETAADLTHFENACNNLIPQGLKKHYERDDVVIEGETFKLRIEAIRTDDKSQRVTIYNDCNRRGSNFVVVPVQIGYCSEKLPGYNYHDLDFMDTIAHEFGHEIVFAGDGIMESLTHKGSSTVSQEHKPDGPIADCDEDSELEIMHYYRRIDEKEYNVGVLDNCFRDDPINGYLWKKEKYFELRKLAARDAMHLITSAQQEPTPSSCLPADHFCGKLCAFGMSECSGDCPRCTLFAGCQPEEEENGEGGDGEGGGGEGDDTCGKICLLRPSTCGSACPRCAFLTCTPALENESNVLPSSTTEAVTTAAAVTTTEDSSGTCGARCTVWNGVCGGACPRCYFFRCREARTNG